MSSLSREPLIGRESSPSQAKIDNILHTRTQCYRREGCQLYDVLSACLARLARHSGRVTFFGIGFRRQLHSRDARRGRARGEAEAETKSWMQSVLHKGTGGAMRNLEMGTKSARGVWKAAEERGEGFRCFHFNTQMRQHAAAPACCEAAVHLCKTSAAARSAFLSRTVCRLRMKGRQTASGLVCSTRDDIGRAPCASHQQTIPACLSL